MTKKQLLEAIAANEVLHELAQERMREHEWMANAAKGAPVIPVKTVEDLDA